MCDWLSPAAARKRVRFLQQVLAEEPFDHVERFLATEAIAPVVGIRKLIEGHVLSRLAQPLIQSA